jgi:hypothetical protein
MQGTKEKVEHDFRKKYETSFIFFWVKTNFLLPLSPNKSIPRVVLNHFLISSNL